MAAMNLQPRTEAELYFYIPTTAEKPFRNQFETSPGVYETNIEAEGRRVPVFDARRLADAPRLDIDGYELVAHETDVDFGDEEAIRSVYYDEAAELVRAATGASRVTVFDHTLRRSGRDGSRQPVRRAHNDYTETSGPQRVRDLMGTEAGALLERRFAIVNVWRPIEGPAAHAPLAICDARSMGPGDFVPADLVYSDRRGETYQVRYSEGQRWFYAPDMAPGEAMLIKCFDSATDGRARFTAHTAFDDPLTPAGAPPRQSIEIRTLAFFD